jgi:DNA-binding NarL/FixJ family response regulator
VSDRPLSLVLVDKDPIFRLGLTTALSSYSRWEIIVQTDNLTEALTQILNNTVDLVILDPSLLDSFVKISQFYKEIKKNKPTTKLCLFSYDLSVEKQQKFKQLGIEGYCNKGIVTEVFIENLERITQGEFLWPTIVFQSNLSEITPKISNKNWISRLQTSGLQQIDANLTSINRSLKNSSISKLDRIFWNGRKRELLTARWLIKELLPVDVIIVSSQVIENQNLTEFNGENLSLVDGLFENKNSLIMFKQTSTKIKKELDNLTGFSLEIDILKKDKKQEILELVLKQFNRIINDLKFIEVKKGKLSTNNLSVLQKLWRESALIFLSKYCTNSQDISIEEIETIVENNEILVSEEILYKISFLTELFNYLLLEELLENETMTNSIELAKDSKKEEKLLQNVIIQVANGIIALILNYFSDNEKVKKNLYNIDMASSREIAKFRNRLAWEHRKQQYWQEPKNIFESQHPIFCLGEKGIECQVMYAPRQQELKDLNGLRWTVTIILEIRDAVSPLLRSLIGTVGKGVVYILTQVIGRGIGLVGKGILQGIGNSFWEKDYEKKSIRKNSKS